MNNVFPTKAFTAFRSSFPREAFILLIYMAVSASVLNIFMQTRSFKEGSTSANFVFSKMLDGSAYRPYVYRQLVPIIANHAARLVPAEEQPAFVERYLERYHLKQHYFGRTKEIMEYNSELVLDDWSAEYAIKYHVVYVIIFFSLIGALYCLRALTVSVLPNEYNLTPFLPALFLLLYPLCFRHGNFFYDLVELFFLTAILLTAIKGNYSWWLLLLPLAVMNKESNILLPLLYFPVIMSSSAKWRARLFIALSFAAALGVYFFIKDKFSQNPGFTFVWQVEDKLAFLTNPANYILWYDFYAPMIPFPRGFNMIWLLALSCLIFWRWDEKPFIAKRLFIFALAINIPLFILLCQTDEIRNLSFLFLPIYLLMAHTLLTRESGGVSID